MLKKIRLQNVNIVFNLLFLIFFIVLDVRSLFFYIPFMAFLIIIKNINCLLIFLKKTPPLIILLPLTLINFVFLRDSLWRFYVLVIPFLFFFIFLLLKNNNFGKINNPKFKIILILLIIYLLSIFSFHGKIHFSGDEPHYLVIANSILYDGDLNIANNHKKDKIKNFWKVKRPLRYHGFYGKKGVNYIYSFHLPALPLMILPFFAFAELINSSLLYFSLIRIGVIFWSLLCALQFFKFLRLSGLKKKISFFATIITFTLTPYLLFATHLYPAIFLTFLILFSINNFYFEKKNYLKVSIALSLMIWAGVKAILILSVLLFMILIKEKKDIFKFKKMLQFSPLLISSLLFGLYLYKSYGSFSLLSIYYGILTPEKQKYYLDLILSLKKIPINIRIDSLFNYFLDQRDGLIFYFPLFFLFFPGIFYFFKKKNKKHWLLCLPFFIHIINYAFNTHRGGYSPPARPIAPFVWFLAFIIILFLKDNWNKNIQKIISCFFALTIFINSFLILYPQMMYQPTTHEIKTRASALFSSFKNSIVNLPAFFPSFLKMNNYNYLPNLTWILLLIIFTCLIINKKYKLINFALAGFMIFIVFVYLLFPYFSMKKYNKYYRLSDEIAVLRTQKTISLTKNKTIELFQEGEKFIPVVLRKNQDLSISFKANQESTILIHNDLNKILKIKTKQNDVFTINFNSFKKINNKYILPLFVRIKPTQKPKKLPFFTLDFNFAPQQKRKR